MNESARCGFTYLVEHIKNGVVVECERVKNIMPIEALNHVLNATVCGGAQITTWYIGLFESAYTPVSTDVMADFPADATECTAYSEATRVRFIPTTPDTGVVTNLGNLAEFTFTGTKTVYGGFISSTPAKGATSGTLLSAVRFSSPKSVDSSSVLRITAGLTFASA